MRSVEFLFFSITCTLIFVIITSRTVGATISYEEDNDDILVIVHQENARDQVKVTVQVLLPPHSANVTSMILFTNELLNKSYLMHEINNTLWSVDVYLFPGNYYLTLLIGYQDGHSSILEHGNLNIQYQQVDVDDPTRTGFNNDTVER
ncbi:MAG: hypothetical protein ACXAEU_24505, partial [Candidatus Hodarchaeales archaeon]